MAGIVNHLIGKMYSLERNIILSKDSKHVDIINRARLRIRESLEDTLTIQEIAQELGISYSSFRKLFQRLALLEEEKTLPFGAVYDYFNLKNNIPVGEEYIADIEKYEAEVLAKRN